jgi:hypothetical protein
MLVSKIIRELLSVWTRKNNKKEKERIEKGRKTEGERREGHQILVRRKVVTRGQMYLVLAVSSGWLLA